MRSLLKGLCGFLRNSKNQSSSSAPPRDEGAASSTISDHWAVMKAEGFTATQVIDYLQPIADLEGISVSYSYKDDEGHEQVYNHRRNDATYENPLSQAIREKRLSKDRAMEFALNEEGRLWIETNFQDFK